MFHLATHLCTTLALLTHALWGCCWHHGHEHDPHVHADGHGEAVVHAHHEHAAHDHRAGDGELDRHADDECPQRQGEPCDGARCSYVDAGKVRLPSDAPIGGAAIDAPVESGGLLAIATAVPAPDDAPPRSLAAAPAVTQVWLL